MYSTWNNPVLGLGVKSGLHFHTNIWDLFVIEQVHIGTLWKRTPLRSLEGTKTNVNAVKCIGGWQVKRWKASRRRKFAFEYSCDLVQFCRRGKSKSLLCCIFVGVVFSFVLLLLFDRCWFETPPLETPFWDESCWKGDSLLLIHSKEKGLVKVSDWSQFPFQIVTNPGQLVHLFSQLRSIKLVNC